MFPHLKTLYMKYPSNLITSVAVLLLSSIESYAAIITVNFDSGSRTFANSNGNTELTGGSSVLNGDGAVLQLGYFNTATSSNPFSGTWVPLTGENGANSAFSIGAGKTSIGDDFSQGAGDGTFAMSLTFDSAVSGRNSSFPTPGTPLAIRVYNATTIANSSHYMTISSNLSTWQWLAPAEPPQNPTVSLSLDDVGLRRENGTAAGVATATFATTLPITAIPEPSTLTFGILTAATLIGSRRRRQLGTRSF
jgi:hypothetical protein